MVTSGADLSAEDLYAKLEAVKDFIEIFWMWLSVHEKHSKHIRTICETLRDDLTAAVERAQHILKTFQLHFEKSSLKNSRPRKHKDKRKQSKVRRPRRILPPPPQIDKRELAPTTIWYHGAQAYSTSNNEAESLSVNAEIHQILQQFLDHPRAHSTEELRKITGHPATLIKRVTAKFGQPVVKRPSRKGDGYLIHVKHAGTRHD